MVRALPAPRDPAAAVRDLWDAHAPGGLLHRCQRMYVEAAALGIFGREPYAGVVREANLRWLGAVVDHLRRGGVPEETARRAATLVDATLMGLQLDQPLAPERPRDPSPLARTSPRRSPPSPGEPARRGQGSA